MVKYCSITVKGTQFQSDIEKFNKKYSADFYKKVISILADHYNIEFMKIYVEQDSKGRNHIHSTFKLLPYRKTIPYFKLFLRNRNIRVHIRTDVLLDRLCLYKWFRYISKDNPQEHNEFSRNLKNLIAQIKRS